MASKSKSILNSLEEKNEQKSSHATKENLSVDYEIECPRCHDVMTLQNSTDSAIFVRNAALHFNSLVTKRKVASMDLIFLNYMIYTSKLSSKVAFQLY